MKVFQLVMHKIKLSVDASSYLQKLVVLDHIFRICPIGVFHCRAVFLQLIIGACSLLDSLFHNLLLECPHFFLKIFPNLNVGWLKNF